jgi:hypothetical protein
MDAATEREAAGAGRERAASHAELELPSRGERARAKTSAATQTDPARMSSVILRY